MPSGLSGCPASCQTTTRRARMWRLVEFRPINDGPGVPMNVVSVNDSQPIAQGGLSVLSLQVAVADDRPDSPVVRVLADGRDPFAEVAPGWRGFDPAEMLGPCSPLLPVDQGRRVAVCRCSCGEPGCGVIGPRDCSLARRATGLVGRLPGLHRRLRRPSHRTGRRRRRQALGSARPAFRPGAVTRARPPRTCRSSCSPLPRTTGQIRSVTAVPEARLRRINRQEPARTGRWRSARGCPVAWSGRRQARLARRGPGR